MSVKDSEKASVAIEGEQRVQRQVVVESKPRIVSIDSQPVAAGGQPVYRKLSFKEKLSVAAEAARGKALSGVRKVVNGKRVGPQSINTDNLPQNWGATPDYHVASTIHLFGEWSDNNNVMARSGQSSSPVEKYGGGLPRFFDKQGSALQRGRVGVNGNKKMFGKGMFG